MYVPRIHMEYEVRKVKGLDKLQELLTEYDQKGWFVYHLETNVAINEGIVVFAREVSS